MPGVLTRWTTLRCPPRFFLVCVARVSNQHLIVDPALRRTEHNPDENTKSVLMSHHCRLHAPTLAPHHSFKERTIENFEPSEVLAQGSALAPQRSDDPQSDRYPPQLSFSMSRAALQALTAVWPALERGRRFPLPFFG